MSDLHHGLRRPGWYRAVVAFAFSAVPGRQTVTPLVAMCSSINWRSVFPDGAAFLSRCDLSRVRYQLMFRSCRPLPFAIARLASVWRRKMPWPPCSVTSRFVKERRKTCAQTEQDRNLPHRENSGGGRSDSEIRSQYDRTTFHARIF
jgi:hypothetical protein